MLTKIKALFVTAALALLAGTVTYATTEVDYQAAFGPGAGVAVAAVVGYVVPEAADSIRAYLNRYAARRA